MAKKPGSKTTTKATKATARKLPKASQKPVNAARQVKPAKRTGWQRLKPVRTGKQLPSVAAMVKTTAIIIWGHRRLFIGISLLYGLFNLLLVRGLSSGIDIQRLRASFDLTTGGHPGWLASGLGTFFSLLGTGSNDPSGASYQLFLLLFLSLAIIWSLRQVLAGHTITIRDAYYRGIFPLIPFIVVLVIIGLQLLPLMIGTTIFSLVLNNGIAVTLLEKIICGGVFGMLVLLTLYWLCSSVFALYIVTLPGMTPIKALRSANELVRHQRLLVFRKLISLPVIGLVLTGLIMVPTIVLIPTAAAWVYVVLSMFAPLLAHSYLYTVYRELLDE